MKDLLLYYFLVLLLKTLSLLPLKWNHYLGTLLGKSFYLHKNGRLRKIAEINISLCFADLSYQQQQTLLKKNLIEVGKAITELGFIWMKPVQQVLDSIQVNGLQQALDCIENKQGVIILTPHLGCWEIAGLFFARHLPFTTLYLEPKKTAFGKIIQNSRVRSGTNLVKADKRGVIALFKTLKNGGASGILPDQNPKDRKSGVFAPFFGHPAFTMTLIQGLILKTGAKVFIGYAKRLPQGKGYQFNLIAADKELYHEDSIISATALNRQIESLITEIPEQYLWSYKRFKVQTDGKKKFY